MGVLNGKSVIVTGAGRGLGRAYAVFMAREGARVVVNDIDGPEAEDAAREIEQAGGEAAAHAGNVGDWTAAAELVDLCASRFGGPDAVVNNAGVTHAASFENETEEQLDRIIKANLKGTFAVAHHAVKRMMARRSGSIVNVTSGAQAGYVQRSAYAASKGAVAAMTYTWALELAPYGIRVNAVSPTAQTRMSEPLPEGAEPPPLRRPENVAPLVAYLASDAARRVTGQVARLDRNVLSLFSHPRPIASAVNTQGWSLEAIQEHFTTTVGARLEPIGVTARGYQFQDGLG